MAMPVYPGAEESTPSRAQYFSWINNTNEGATEAQTLINLAFFRYLRDEFGMTLDVYAWDAGNLDGPGGGYGKLTSEKFCTQYPDGWRKIADTAKEIGCRLGLWGGPDGFGDTPEEAQERIELIAGLCRDYHLMLLKFDGVCGTLRPEKQDAFVEMMTRCREHSPDLILLNHRLELGKGMPHATTFLWEGAETYIDVHMTNACTAPHARAEALARGLPPGLTRLTEDHGVCLSSCLDYWEDDLILQAFNRCLILAPEIYGNPWLLRDAEFPRLARIYNLHRRYREIMVKGMILPVAQYGPHAVARGDASTRLLTLRNLNWEPIKYQVRLDEEIGLTAVAPVHVRQFHPTERILGEFATSSVIEIEVLPFRACVLLVTTTVCPEPGVCGCDYEVIRDCAGHPLQIDLLGLPGATAVITLAPDMAGSEVSATFGGVQIEGVPADALLNGGQQTVVFPDTPHTEHWHRKLADLHPVPLPQDAESLCEATFFRAENNALEVRSLHRSGPTRIPAVAAARESFFEQELFRQRGVWDRYLFDGRSDTFFSVWQRGRDLRVHGGSLRVNFGSVITPDSLQLQALASPAHAQSTPLELHGELSADLLTWLPVTFRPTLQIPTENVPVADIQENGGIVHWQEYMTVCWKAEVPHGTSVRYLRLPGAPDRIARLSAFSAGAPLPSTNWQANHLMPPYATTPAIAAWYASVRLGTEANNSYLCVAMEGEHGEEKALAALRVNGDWIGASERAPSFPGVPWEADIRRTGANHTFFFPLEDRMQGQEVEVYAFVLKGGGTEVKPAVWMTAYPVPRMRKRLTLDRI